MEGFTRHPQNVSASNRALNNNNNENNEDQSYLSLSQFDVELQQQARLAMQQEIETWQDFENYLPPADYSNDNTHLINHHQHQLPSPPHIPTYNDFRRQSDMNGQFADLVANTGLPMNNVLSTSAMNTNNNGSIIFPACNDNTTTTPWNMPNNKVNTLSKEQSIKLEYASPEHVSLISPSSFDSPDSLLHAASDNSHSHSIHSPDHRLNDEHFFPISAINTPLETQLHSPKVNIFAPPPANFCIQQNNLQTSTGKKKP
jgi:hypothetical protein